MFSPPHPLIQTLICLLANIEFVVQILTDSFANQNLLLKYAIQTFTFKLYISHFEAQILLFKFGPLKLFSSIFTVWRMLSLEMDFVALNFFVLWT